MRRSVFATPYLIWMILFIVVPLLLIIYYAFTADGSFSFANLAKAFEPIYFSVLLRSLMIAGLCTVICLLLGYPLAMILARSSASTSFILMLIMLPMWMNFLLRTYAWLALLDTNGLINRIISLMGFPKAQLLYNLPSIVFGMVYNFLPFMILPIYTVLQKIPRSLIEAAEDLGADSYTVFKKVTLPLSVPGIISGITMVFMPAVTTFAISRLLGGSHFMMLGDLIENQFVFLRDWNFGSALSFVMMVIILISMAILSKTESFEEGDQLW
ncbi:MAG: ABC transporter permease [Christensenellales bacterium]|jgi:spermidine/putrescine transport system permease protein